MALLAAGALTLGLTACGSDDSSDNNGNNASGGSKGGDNYVTVKGSEPQNPLIPGNTNEVGGGNIVDMIYSGLVYYDKDGNTHNDMAESIDLEGDTTYRVKLRDDIVVMRQGVAVEQGHADAIFDRPQDPYTRNLINSVPGLGIELGTGAQLGLDVG